MKNNNRCFRFAVIFSIAIFLSACGSGGGGGGESTSSSAPSSPPPEPIASTLNFPVESTIVTLATTSVSFTLYASDTYGNGYLLTASFSPGPVTVYPYIYPSALPTYYSMASLKINGILSTTSVMQTFYSTGPFLVRGATDDESTVSPTTQDYMRTSTQTPLPVTAKVGAVGPMYSGLLLRTFSGSDYTFPRYKERATWSLEADTETTAWLCVNTETTSANWSIYSMETDCFKINQAGSILGLKADITTGGTTLKFR